MKRNHALQIVPDPLEIGPERDPAACLRRASELLALGGLADAAYFTRKAAEIIEAKKRAH